MTPVTRRSTGHTSGLPGHQTPTAITYTVTQSLALLLHTLSLAEHPWNSRLTDPECVAGGSLAAELAAEPADFSEEMPQLR